MRNMRDPPHLPLVSSKSVLAAVKGQPFNASMSAEEKAQNTKDATHLSPRARREEESRSTLSKQPPHQQPVMPSDSQVTLVGENQVEVDQSNERLPDGQLDRANLDNGREGETEAGQNSSGRVGESLSVNESSGLQDLTGTPKQKANAMSAFEITSVIDPAEGDDMDTSIRHLATIDSDSTTTTTDRSPAGRDPPSAGQSQSSEQPHPPSSMTTSSSTTTMTEYKTVASNGTHAPTAAPEGATKPASLSSSSSSSRPFPLSSSSSSSFLPSLAATQVGGGAAPGGQQQGQVPPAAGGNGPQHQQQPVKRFRRVNHYMRSRWSVRDRSEAEQKPESSQGALHSSSQKSLHGSPELQGHGAPSPVPTRRTVLDSSDEGQHGHLPSVGNEQGHSHSDTTSERDPQEVLSRNESMSSLVTTEKSIDGDEHLQDVETESAAPYSTDSGITVSTPDVTYPPSHPPAASSSGSSSHGVLSAPSTGVSSASTGGSVVSTASTTHTTASSLSLTSLQRAVVLQSASTVVPLPPASVASSSASETNNNGHGISCFCEICLQ